MSSQNPHQIENDIEQTRQDILTTIEALQQRFQPQQMLQGALGGARDTTAQAAQSISQTVKDLAAQVQERLHDAPLAAAVLGALLGWMNSMTQKADQVIHSTTPQAVGQRVQEGVDQIREQAEQLAAQARDRAGHLGEQVQQTAEQRTQQAQQQIEHTLAGMEQTLKENPWLLGVMTLAVGIAVGLALPESQQERELVGNARDALTHKVRTMVEEAMGTARAAAQALLHPPLTDLQSAPPADTL